MQVCGIKMHLNIRYLLSNIWVFIFFVKKCLPKYSPIEQNQCSKWDDSSDKKPDKMNIDERVVLVKPQVSGLIDHHRHVHVLLHLNFVANLLKRRRNPVLACLKIIKFEQENLEVLIQDKVHSVRSSHSS